MFWNHQSKCCPRPIDSWARVLNSENSKPTLSNPYGFKYDIDKRRRELRGCFEYVFRCPSFLLKAS